MWQVHTHHLADSSAVEDPILEKSLIFFYLIYTQMPTAMGTRVNTAVWLETAHQQNCSFIGGILDT